MLQLLKNCKTYTPKYLGIRDVLIANSKIIDIGPDLRTWEHAPNIEVRNLDGRILVPGLVDNHVHVTGGGGEQGPVSRTPELKLTDFTLNGVSSVVGLLGTDGISRSLENLLAKCKALETEGISTWMLTGNYHYPSKTLTGAIDRDLYLVDKVIGTKIALADHRSSFISTKELAEIAGANRSGGLISGKPGLIIVHMGSAEEKMEKIFWVLDHHPVPARSFLPTHCARPKELIKEGVDLIKRGGNIDFTADSTDEASASNAVMTVLELGGDLSHLSISSDAGGSMPIFDEQGVCIGMGVGTSSSLLDEVRRLVFDHLLPLDQALSLVTENPARLIGQAGIKGTIAEGADADLLVLNDKLEVEDLYLKGRLAVKDGEAIMKGHFE